MMEMDTRGGLPLLVRAGKGVSILVQVGHQGRIAVVTGRHLLAALRLTQLHDSV